MSVPIGETLRVVVVHDDEHSEWHKAIENAQLHPPLIVENFVSSEGLSEAAQRANALFIQRSLMDIPDSPARLAVREAIASPLQDRNVYFFNDDYIDPEQQPNTEKA